MANSYLTRTFGSAGNRKTWTWSGWVKRNTNASGFHALFEAGRGTNPFFVFSFYEDGINVAQTAGVSADWNSTRKFRDTNGFYHVMLVVDTTSATSTMNGSSTDRMRVYVNNEQVVLSGGSVPSQNADLQVNQAIQHNIGGYNAISNMFDGYMSHVAFVDGQALAPTVFGQTDSTSGIWKFKAPSGVTWGTNGFHLKFENSGNLGLDSSGNSNTLAVNGNGRQALDTPSNVYATLNPLSSSATLTTGNTTGATADSTWRPASTTIGMLGTTGKYYAEFKVISGNNNYVGVYNLNTNFGTSQSTADANRIAYSTYDGEIMRTLTGESTIAGLATSGSSDVVGIAINKNDGEVKFYKNGTLIQTVSHSNITNYDLMIGCQLGYTSSSCFNFGNGYFGTTAISSAGSNGNGSLFEYDVPSGYYALNTKNINTYG